MVQVNHNTEEHPAQTPFDPLPEDEYVVVLDKAERKNLKDPSNRSEERRVGKEC